MALLSSRIQFRRDNLSAWNTINPILKSGEIALVENNNSLSAGGEKKWTLRIGDGSTRFNNLPELAYALSSAVHEEMDDLYEALSGYTDEVSAGLSGIFSKKLETKNAISVDGVQSDLLVQHIALSDYEEMVHADDGSILSNCLYVTSSLTLDMYGEKIVNLAAGTDASDAVNVGQLSSAIHDAEYSQGTGITITDKTIAIDEDVVAKKTDLTSVGNATVTVRQGENTITSFTLNQSSDVSVQIPNNYYTTSQTSSATEIQAGLDEKSSISVDGELADVQMKHILIDDYRALYEQGQLDSKTLYVVSGDNIDAFGQQIKNVANGTSDTDAVNIGQLDSAKDVLMGMVDDVSADIQALSGSINTMISGDAQISTNLPDIELSGSQGTFPNGGFCFAMSCVSNLSSYGVQKISQIKTKNAYSRFGSGYESTYLYVYEFTGTNPENYRHVSCYTLLGVSKNRCDFTLHSVSPYNTYEFDPININFNNGLYVFYPSTTNNTALPTTTNVRQGAIQNSTLFPTTSKTKLFNGIDNGVFQIGGSSWSTDYIFVTQGCNGTAIADVRNDIPIKVSQLANDSGYITGSQVNIGYDKDSKKISLTADSNVTEFSTSSFVIDGMLESAYYNVDTHEIILDFNTDAGKDSISVNVSALVDTYTAGNGLSVNGNQFAIDTNVVATQTVITNLTGTYYPKTETSSATEIQTALNEKSAISVDGVLSDAGIEHATLSDYAAMLSAGTIKNNVIYVVSSLNMDMCGEKITNLQNGTDISDAVNYGQLTSAISENTYKNRLAGITYNFSTNADVYRAVSALVGIFGGTVTNFPQS